MFEGRSTSARRPVRPPAHAVAVATVLCVAAFAPAPAHALLDTVLLNLNGAAAADSFGLAVAFAGDLNGDGYDDFVVGAPRHGATDAGRVTVYFGAIAFNGTPDGTLNGEAAGDWFGFSVAGAGDVNGDGYDDLIVGAPMNDAGGVDAGRAYVFLGGPGTSFDATADGTITGVAAADSFGFSVASAGNANGDAYDDIVVGAPGNDTGGAAVGRAYVYFGAAGGSFDATPEAQLAGAAAGDRFGWSVSGAGDVNGDGYDDVLVGALLNDLGAVDQGRAYLYFGAPGAGFDATADASLGTGAGGDRFGSAVAGIGNVNGDAYDDIAVGAPLNDATGADAGRAYVYFGGAGAFDVVADGSLPAVFAGDHFGGALSPAGDVNRDGYPDLLVGAPDATWTGPGQGRVFVFYGGAGASFNSVSDYSINGTINGDRLGTSVASGNFNGDAYVDVLYGVPGRDASGTNAGAANLVTDATQPCIIFDTIPLPFGSVCVGSDSLRTFKMRNTGGMTAAVTFIMGGLDAGDFSVAPLADTLVSGDSSLVTVTFAPLAAGSRSAGLTASYNGSGCIASTPLSGTGVASSPLMSVPSDPLDFGSSRVTVSSATTRTVTVTNTGVTSLDVSAVLSGAHAGDWSMTPPLPSFTVTPGNSHIVTLTFTPGGEGARAATLALTEINPCVATTPVNIALGGIGLLQGLTLVSPNGGESWPVGATRTVIWQTSERADVYLSVDGGASWPYQLASDFISSSSDSQRLSIQAPHTPTRFAKVQVVKSGEALGSFNSDVSDSFFTIETSISLLAFVAGSAPDGRGVLISWRTDPAPQDLLGYGLERAEGAKWTTVVALTRATEVLDRDGATGARYRLTARNLFGTSYLLGETSVLRAAALAAWPLPYRGGELEIAFASASGLGGASGRAVVAVYDLRGGRVRTVLDARLPAGYHTARWDGRDEGGRDVASGLYFLTAASGADRRTIRIVVVR